MGQISKLLPLLVALASLASGNKLGDYQYDEDYEYYNENGADYDADDYPNKEAAVEAVDLKIVTESKHLIVDSGTTIHLPCEVDYLPEQVSIMWRRPDAKKNQLLVLHDKVQDPNYKDRTVVDITDKGSILSIGVANPSDAGRYTCSLAVQAVAGNKKKSVTHTVSIRVPPEISKHSESVIETEAGRQVRLMCAGTGSPKPTVKWTRVGKGKLADGSTEKEGEELMISNVNRHDAGVYRCTANNGFTQQASKDIELRVLFQPEIEVQEVFVHTKAGKDVEIVCNVHGEPRPKVTWMKDGIAVQEDARLKLQNIHSKHSLTIHQVERSDFGEYSCHATSTKGAAHKTIQISGVVGPAEFKSDPAGKEPNTYVLEWNVVSFTPVTAFRIETREAGTTAWKQWTAEPMADGPYHYAGKLFVKTLSEATRYEARVEARNDEGWSKNKDIFYFATLGAEPLPESMTGGCGESSVVPITILLAFVLRSLL